MKINLFKLILLLHIWLMGISPLFSQCGGMTYKLQAPIVLADYQYQKSYNLYGNGDYKHVMYTSTFEENQSYYFYVHRRNTNALYSIKVISINKELVFENNTDNYLHFTVPKSGLYYLIFEPQNKCNSCDCGIAILSKKLE